jgi:phage host-nuclease inhibitor protein Gam
MDIPKPVAGTGKTPKRFKVTSRPAETPEQRDSKDTIYAVRSIADLSREVLRRITEDSNKKP